MALWKTARNPGFQPGYEFLKGQATLAALAAAAAAPLLLLVTLLPRALVLPVFCLLALTGAALVAAVAWIGSARRHSDRITPWDIAGALVFIGFAAGAISDPDRVLALFDRMSMTR